MRKEAGGGEDARLETWLREAAAAAAAPSETATAFAEVRASSAPAARTADAASPTRAVAPGRRPYDDRAYPMA